MEQKRFGVLGYSGEYKPRFGLWLNTSPECQQAIKGILSEGFDCDVVLKMGCRCAKHGNKTFRPVISLSVYAALLMNGGDVEPDCDDNPTGSCYVREVFFPEHFNLRRRGDA
jgi:hypothetical protein